MRATNWDDLIHGKSLRRWLATPAQDIHDIVRAASRILAVQLCLLPSQLIVGRLLYSLNLYKPVHLHPLLEYTFPEVMLIVVSMIPLEELIFRVPLILPVRRYGLHWQTAVSVVLLAVLFGWAHGSLYNALFQGVFGLLLGLLFLKAGGLTGQYVQAYFTTLGLHYLWDFISIPIGYYLFWLRRR